MATLINYSATGANALKNWDLMTRAAPTKLSVEKDFRFWPFHEMFMNHIENMGWIDALVFNESGTDYNIATDFGQVTLETIETGYQTLEAGNLPQDIVKKLKFRGFYTWIFNSSDESAQDFLAETSDKHHRSGPLAWKLITTKILRGVKQGIRRAQNMIHTLSLETFDNNIKLMVKALKGNRKILASCGESESSILANLLRVLKTSPNPEFNSYIGRFQDKYDDGTNIDLDDFMNDIVIKYETLIEDGQWEVKSEKDVEILALNCKIDELKTLFAKQSSYRDKSGTNNNNKPGFKSWKAIAPKTGESWSQEKNGRTWHWCKHHEYWTATHNSKNCRTQNETATNETESTTEPSLAINMASLSNDNLSDDIFGMVATFDSNEIAPNELDGIFDGNMFAANETMQSKD